MPITDGIRYTIEGDESSLLEAFKRAQKAAEQTAQAMARSFSAATSSIAQAIEAIASPFSGVSAVIGSALSGLQREAQSAAQAASRGTGRDAAKEFQEALAALSANVGAVTGWLARAATETTAFAAAMHTATDAARAFSGLAARALPAERMNPEQLDAEIARVQGQIADLRVQRGRNLGPQQVGEFGELGAALGETDTKRIDQQIAELQIRLQRLAGLGERWAMIGGNWQTTVTNDVEQKQIDLFEHLTERLDQRLGEIQARGGRFTATPGEIEQQRFQVQAFAEAQRLGIDITPEKQVDLQDMAKAAGAAAQAAAEAQIKFQELRAIGSDVASSLSSVFNKFLDGQKVGWGDFLRGLAKQLANTELRQLMGVVFGNTANPLGVFSGLIPGRAEGGAVSAGAPYWVGEKGMPELFVPRTSGTIVPPGAMGGGSTTIRMSIDLKGANGDETIRRIAGQTAAQAAVAAVQQANAGYAARGRQLQMLGA